MAFCTNCGSSINGIAVFCVNCGEKVSGRTDAQNKDNNSADDSSKTYAILAVVLPILFFLPLVTEPKTEFGTFWANQALILLLAFSVASFFTFIFIGYLLGIATTVLWILSIISVSKGEMKPIPLIGEIVIIE